MYRRACKEDGDISPAAWMLGIIAVVFVFVAAVKPHEELPPQRTKVTSQEALLEKAFPLITAAPLPVRDAPPEVRIEVNIPATEFTLYENDTALFRKPVAIGQGVYPTPEQKSYIRMIEWNPWWIPPPGADWVKDFRPRPPGPRNPMGLVKLPLSRAILFHGTPKAWSVGRPASHGCMRMHNGDVTMIAWYLQSNFSKQNDPSLREVYRNNGGKTYKVSLDIPVPVKLVYRPVVARDDSLHFYPDYYGKLWGRRKEAIIAELIRYGVDLSVLDDDKIEELARQWPHQDEQVPIARLMRNPPPVDLLSAPESG